MNAPDRFESFLLQDGEKKISYQKDTKVPNAASFTILKEDHTLGNMIREQLLQDPNVIFSGYRNPHPLDPKIVVRVQTKNSNYTPVDAFTNAVNDLISEISLLEERFRAEVDRKKDRQDAAGFSSYY
eukprot:Sdes_comp18684_c0_seq1m8955